MQGLKCAPLHLTSAQACSPQILMDELDHYQHHYTSYCHPRANSLSNPGNTPNHQGCQINKQNLWFGIHVQMQHQLHQKEGRDDATTSPEKTNARNPSYWVKNMQRILYGCNSLYSSRKDPKKNSDHSRRMQAQDITNVRIGYYLELNLGLIWELFF